MQHEGLARQQAMIPNYWPTAQQELLLQAALLPGEAARAAWLRIRASIRSGPLDAPSESLLPLVYRNIVSLGDVGDDIESLKMRYVHTWSDNLTLYQTVRPLLLALERAGIDAVVLKGLALVARVYGDLGVRPMADVDLLVAPADLDRTAAIAADLGWQPRYRLTPDSAASSTRRRSTMRRASRATCTGASSRRPEATRPTGSSAPMPRRSTSRALDSGSSRRRTSFSHVCGHAARWNEVPAIRWVPMPSQ